MASTAALVFAAQGATHLPLTARLLLLLSVFLAVGNGSYAVLYGVAGVCAIIGAVAILPVKRVR